MVQILIKEKIAMLQKKIKNRDLFFFFKIFFYRKNINENFLFSDVHFFLKNKIVVQSYSLKSYHKEEFERNVARSLKILIPEFLGQVIFFFFFLNGKPQE
jgi:hypothetical protein